METGKIEKQIRFRRAIGLSFLFILWLLFTGWFFTYFTPAEIAASSIEKASFKVEESETCVEYTQEEIQEARGIIEAVRRYADIYQEGSHLVVEFKNYVHPDDIMELVSSIADADCVLTKGHSRNIYFYDPSNKQIAHADFSCTDL